MTDYLTTLSAQAYVISSWWIVPSRCGYSHARKLKPASKIQGKISKVVRSDSASLRWRGCRRKLKFEIAGFWHYCTLPTIISSYCHALRRPPLTWRRTAKASPFLHCSNHDQAELGGKKANLFMYCKFTYNLLDENSHLKLSSWSDSTSIFVRVKLGPHTRSS